MMMMNCSYPGPEAPGAPCANAGEISTWVSNAVCSEPGSIPSRPRRSAGFRRLPASLAEGDEAVLEAPRRDGLAQLAHEGLVVMQVVQGIEPRAQDLVDLLEMVQVGPGEMGAGVATTGLVERLRVVAVARVADLDVAEAGEQPAVPRVARRQHAVEHVDPGGHGLGDVLGGAHPHEIARGGRRQALRRMAHDAALVALRLAHREAADGVAVEADAGEPGERLVAQALEHAALHDAEERVRIAFVGAPGPLRPAQRQMHRVR